MLPRPTDPVRAITFSTYYDAAATSKDTDYGSFSSIVAEDFYFSSGTRAVACGRLRREVRNNPYLAGLVNKYPEAIGYSNLRTRTSSRDYNAKKDAWWYRRRRFAMHDGGSRRTLERLVKLELLIAGEIFLVKLRGGRVQAIPSEFCGSPIGTKSAATGAREVNGIIYATDGTVAGYRFGKMSDAGVITDADTTPTAAEFVIHVRDRDRVQMGRGIPWLLASLKTARDLYEITRSKTKQIKDANSISGFIEKAGASTAIPGLGGTSLDPETGAPKVEETTDPANPVPAAPIVIELRPGMFIALEPGEKIHSLMSQYNATDYKELIMLMLHAMSTPVGLPVELWFSGLGDVSYSGYKGLGVQWDGRRKDVIEFLVDVFFDPYHRWLVELDTKLGDLPPNPDGDDELHDWMFRRTPILDDEKAGKANKIRLESGESDLAEIWEERGYYAEEVFERRRQLWIKLQIAAGDLKAGEDHTAVKVPIDFLLRNELPGETTVPHIPDGSGVTSAIEDAADAAAADANQAKSSADRADAAARRAETAAAKFSTPPPSHARDA